MSYRSSVDPTASVGKGRSYRWLGAIVDAEHDRFVWTRSSNTSATCKTIPSLHTTLSSNRFSGWSTPWNGKSVLGRECWAKLSMIWYRLMLYACYLSLGDASESNGKFLFPSPMALRRRGLSGNHTMVVNQANSDIWVSRGCSNAMGHECCIG